MVRKYVIGNPFPTEAVVQEFPPEKGLPEQVRISTDNGFELTCSLEDGDRVYGLGENVRGINKRGFRYISDCADAPHHYEDVSSLYAAHNFLIVAGHRTFGLFLDYPATMTFDVGYEKMDELRITCDRADLDLYVLDGDGPQDIVHTFRCMIGRSYIPPRFAFGFGQSRWGYMNEDDIRDVVRKHREAHVPLDMVYMDIDYMERYKDFTVNAERYPDFPAFVEEMRREHVRLIPIIDAGVKIEKGYGTYEEGVAGNYFCKNARGEDFVGEVWPGWVHFPDVLNPEAREWFGGQYRFLVDQGIEGFWNDMNEPSIFKTPEGEAEAKEAARRFADAPAPASTGELQAALRALPNSHENFRRFFHRVGDRMVCHDDVHNLFGYNMTRAAGEAFERMYPDRRILLFSRSSYVGMHRYGGIWQGDNYSWWSHLLLNLKMMPSLNMVGFLYTGADLGGFGSNCSRDLVLRWLALGVFTPLMRNHSAIRTREQEFYRFERPEDFRAVISVRYRLLPYLYSEYMKAALGNDMMFRPLAFVYPEDPVAVEIEDQLMLGDEIMIAPVYQQNMSGRFVYLPETMMLLRFLPDGRLEETVLEKGSHYIPVALNEVILLIRQGRALPLGDVFEYEEAVDDSDLVMHGFPGASYELYSDDGMTRMYDRPENRRTLHMPET